ncbi:TVA4 protein, partial [Origma solitaria]|nr:TVA4 protein [Origma solitaria]
FSVAVTVARAQIQQEPSLETPEDTGINISCSHPNIQTNDYIHFYRHFPGRGPEFLTLTARGSKDLPDIAGQV